MRLSASSLIKILRPSVSVQETLLHLLLASVITLSVLTFPLNFVEAPLYDFRQWLSIKPKADDRIAIVTIDDQTLNQLNEASPLSLNDHLKAVQEFERQEVKGVGYIIDFNRVQKIDSHGFQSEVLQDFYRSTVRLNAQGIPFMLGIPYDLTGEVTAPYPLSQIPQAVSIVHKDGTVFGKDKVTRRALLSLYDRLALEMSLVNRIYSNDTISNPPGTYKATEADAQYFLLKYHQNNGVVYDANYESFPYPRYSFIDLIEGKLPAGTLKDKIVLVGTFQRDNPNDFTLMSSLSQYGLAPKVLIQANILDSILNHQGVTEVPEPLLGLFCFILSLAIIIASFKVRPSRLILLTLYLIAGTFILSLVLFQSIPVVGNFWLPLGAPLLSLTLSFYLMIPLRLYSEHRKRYELENENKMLIAVEELKTNFLQLVTHDLKTPVAKIQGLTEQLKRSLSEKLTAKDLEVMNHILAANDDLNHFISSLLELTKLDNQGIRVNLQSKDINSLLESIILKHRFVAQAKQIRILTHFEPLFPAKFDVELISKVLSNLIDNAIKYSPEGTEVRISTHEVGTSLEIQIQDQGIGIPESERQNLFSRFYRIKNDTTQKVKGTGLGLYLSKYFIEAHHGSIQIDSTEGVGTTFKILIPIDLDEKKLTSVGLKTLPFKSNIERNKEQSHA